MKDFSIADSVLFALMNALLVLLDRLGNGCNIRIGRYGGSRKADHGAPTPVRQHQDERHSLIKQGSIS